MLVKYSWTEHNGHPSNSVNGNTRIFILKVLVLEKRREEAWNKLFSKIGNYLDLNCQAAFYSLQFVVQLDEQQVLRFGC
jgi:hypothetical protein